MFLFSFPVHPMSPFFRALIPVYQSHSLRFYLGIYFCILAESSIMGLEESQLYRALGMEEIVV